MGARNTRPLLTFALIAFNDEAYVNEAIVGAFSQTYQPLEIILSDDCSADLTFAIMEKAASEYRGPHKIILNRNPENLGLSGHLNRVMELSKGELIIIAAADDISLPSRTERIYGAYIASGCKALSIHSSCMVINSTGDTLGYIPAHQGCGESLEAVIENGTHVYGCTHAWHRIVFDKFGPLPTTVKQEDEVIPFRSLILGTILSISEPLVHYRLHSDNASLAYKKRATSPNELQDLYSTQYANRLDNLRCYLHDLERAVDCIGERRTQRIRNMLGAMIRDCELELAFRRGSFQDKLSVLRQGIAKGASARSLFRWFIRIVSPYFYSKWCYYRYLRTPGTDLVNRD